MLSFKGNKSFEALKKRKKVNSIGMVREVSTSN